MSNLVFIIIRHVNNATSNVYWKESYNSIREVYPDTKIVIIDDNSTYDTGDDKFETVNCEVVKSEFPKRGELLPYYYFHKLHFADKAVIVHDSVFVNDIIDTDSVDTYRPLWVFEHNWDTDGKTINFLKQLDQSNELINFYKQKDKWKGCFGAMTIISWKFLDKINTEFNFFEVLLKLIKTRENRMQFERIIACACAMLDEQQPSIYGNIHKWCHTVTNGKQKFGIKWNTYVGNKENFKKHNIMKVWSGR